MRDWPNAAKAVTAVAFTIVYFASYYRWVLPAVESFDHWLLTRRRR